MGAYNLKHFKNILSALEPGEVILAGAIAVPEGFIKKGRKALPLTGLVGAAIATSGEGQAGSFVMPGRMVLGLTNSRLLVCIRDSWSGHPKSVHSSIRLSEIRSAELEQSKTLRRARFSLSDGTTLSVETEWQFGASMDDLLAKIQPLLD